MLFLIDTEIRLLSSDDLIDQPPCKGLVTHPPGRFISNSIFLFYSFTFLLFFFLLLLLGWGGVLELITCIHSRRMDSVPAYSSTDFLHNDGARTEACHTPCFQGEDPGLSAPT